MRIVNFSDPHFDWSTAGVPRYEDLREASDEVVEYAVKNSADLVICLGDVGDPDSQRTHLASARAVAVSTALAECDIPSRWLVGNHDVNEDGTGASTLSALASAGLVLCNGDTRACRVYEAPTVEHFTAEPGDGVELNIVALPYVPRSHAYDPERWVLEEMPDLLSPTSLLTLVIGHLNLEGIGPGSETIDMPRGRDVFWPLAALEKTLAGREVIMLGGHYHRRQLYRGVHIVGSLGQLTFGEADVTPSFSVLEVG